MGGSGIDEPGVRFGGRGKPQRHGTCVDRARGGNGAFGASAGGISQDGTRVFLNTSEPLVSADTDDCSDVYERAGATTTLVSTGPAGPTSGL